MEGRRKFLLAAGSAATIAVAGCVEGGEEEEESEPEPPASIASPEHEIDVFMVEAFDYLNGHREEPPTASFDAGDLKQPWRYYVESLQYQME